MFALYLAALAVGLGLLVMQLAFGHDTGGHDAHAAGHEGSPWAAVASLRFWSFALLAGGFVGATLSGFRLLGPAATAVLASGDGIGAGLLAVTVLRRLFTRSPQSLGSQNELVGRTARVLVPIEGLARGKVRVDLRGSYVDIAARAGASIEAGALVVLEEVSAGEAIVSRAPPELE